MLGADLIFMPYNYLIDEKIRENFEIDYSNSVIIFDEAHNIAPCCEEQASFEVKSGHLDSVLKELHDLQENQKMNEDKEWKAENSSIAQIKIVTECFNKFINKFSLDPKSNSATCLENLSNNRYLPDQSIVL